MERFDALVVGGGPAGATAAILLARAGWDVVLVERRSFPRRKVCGEYLSPTNWPLLRSLRLLEAFRDLAGPPVRETAVFAHQSSRRARLPLAAGDQELWGRALAREHLDTLLLEEAAAEGVDVRQPGRCVQIKREPAEFESRIERQHGDQPSVVHTRVVIAAHGSWELGSLRTERQPAPHRPGDLLAFKAHFRDTGLPEGLMPLLSFPDGYGGMVHCDGGRASLSCCIRRDRLLELERCGGQVAGEAVFQHLLGNCPALLPVFESAVPDGAWMSAGPIQPGFRGCYREGVFVVGNAAGEAHPVVAEGISMAMQSAWLLTEQLAPHRNDVDKEPVRNAIGKAYSAAWKRSFVPRIRASTAVARWAMRPRLVSATLPLLRGCPGLLTWGARLSGKAWVVVRGAESEA